MSGDKVISGNSRSPNLLRGEGTLPTHLGRFQSEDADGGGSQVRPRPEAQRPEHHPQSLSKNRWLSLFTTLVATYSAGVATLTEEAGGRGQGAGEASPSPLLWRVRVACR